MPSSQLETERRELHTYTHMGSLVGMGEAKSRMRLFTDEWLEMTEESVEWFEKIRRLGLLKFFY